MPRLPNAHDPLADWRAGRAKRRHVEQHKQTLTRAARVGIAVALTASLLYVGTTLLGTLGGVVQRLALAP